MTLRNTSQPADRSTARAWRRRVGALVGAGVLAVSLVACGGAESAARDAAKQWMDDLNAGNVTAAMERSTEATKTLLQMGSAMGQSMGPGEYKITKVEMTGDNTARVTVDAANGNSPSELDLVRIDGQWKVGFKK